VSELIDQHQVRLLQDDAVDIDFFERTAPILDELRGYQFQSSGGIPGGSVSSPAAKM